jgi:hypothetical protein
LKQVANVNTVTMTKKTSFERKGFSSAVRAKANVQPKHALANITAGAPSVVVLLMPNARTGSENIFCNLRLRGCLYGS